MQRGNTFESQPRGDTKVNIKWFLSWFAPQQAETMTQQRNNGDMYI